MNIIEDIKFNAAKNKLIKTVEEDNDNDYEELIKEAKEMEKNGYPIMMEKIKQIIKL